MLTGFNTNVPYKGKIYHVQTEDGGARNPVLTTLLYYQGAILTSEKSSYAELLVEEDWKEKALERMKDQHRKVIKTLMLGKYTGDAEKPAAAAAGEEGARERTLDEIVLDHVLDMGA